MQTVVMPENATAVPWLEVDFHGGSPERVVLEKFPFIMGRGETADLRVPSTRVSREHAVITKQGRTFTLRDLGSTNGTFINGKRTTEAPLNDGDVVLLADEQLTFSNGENTPRQMTTQVMGARGAKGESELPDTKFLIAAVRRLQEAVVHRSGQLPAIPMAAFWRRCGRCWKRLIVAQPHAGAARLGDGPWKRPPSCRIRACCSCRPIPARSATIT
jgi:hypothetical protein